MQLFCYFLSYLVFLILGFTVVKPFYASQIKGADAEIMEMGIEYLRTVMISLSVYLHRFTLNAF